MGAGDGLADTKGLFLMLFVDDFSLTYRSIDFCNSLVFLASVCFLAVAFFRFFSYTNFDTLSSMVLVTLTADIMVNNLMNFWPFLGKIKSKCNQKITQHNPFKLMQLLLEIVPYFSRFWANVFSLNTVLFNFHGHFTILSNIIKGIKIIENYISNVKRVVGED